jgi:hypothetical protein
MMNSVVIARYLINAFAGVLPFRAPGCPAEQAGAHRRLGDG